MQSWCHCRRLISLQSDLSPLIDRRGIVIKWDRKDSSLVNMFDDQIGTAFSRRSLCAANRTKPSRSPMWNWLEFELGFPVRGSCVYHKESWLTEISRRGYSKFNSIQSNRSISMKTQYLSRTQDPRPLLLICSQVNWIDLARDPSSNRRIIALVDNHHIFLSLPETVE